MFKKRNKQPENIVNQQSGFVDVNNLNENISMASNMRNDILKIKKRNKQLLIIAGVFVLLAGAVPIYRTINSNILETQCTQQRNSVNQEVLSFRASYQDFPNEVNEIESATGIICPAGGDYIWDPVGGVIFCSEHYPLKTE